MVKSLFKDPFQVQVQHKKIDKKMFYRKNCVTKKLLRIKKEIFFSQCGSG